jgi:hypothetical protein
VISDSLQTPPVNRKQSIARLHLNNHDLRQIEINAHDLLAVWTAIDSLGCEIAIFDLNQVIHFLFAKRANRLNTALLTIQTTTSYRVGLT